MRRRDLVAWWPCTHNIDFIYSAKQTRNAEFTWRRGGTVRRVALNSRCVPRAKHSVPCLPEILKSIGAHKIPIIKKKKKKEEEERPEGENIKETKKGENPIAK